MNEWPVFSSLKARHKKMLWCFCDGVSSLEHTTTDFFEEVHVTMCVITMREHVEVLNRPGAENMFRYSSVRDDGVLAWQNNQLRSVTVSEPPNWAVAWQVGTVWMWNHCYITFDPQLSHKTQYASFSQESALQVTGGLAHYMTEAHISSNHWHLNCLVLLDCYLTHPCSFPPRIWVQSASWQNTATSNRQKV